MNKLRNRYNLKLIHVSFLFVKSIYFSSRKKTLFSLENMPLEKDHQNNKYLFEFYIMPKIKYK